MVASAVSASMEPWLRLDRADTADARELLGRCCGSTSWVEGMLARRPFCSRDALLATARDIWLNLDRSDWLEAFSHHPKIGDRAALRQRLAATRHLSAREQAGAESASEATFAALAEANEEYEKKFGYIFIVCATGRSADEMLGMLRARLMNDPEREIRIAADEQAEITALRLLSL
jgi:2-oxo-4-hydroxy-4-carboxy-5-ureidoimidazoline decarboxylase